MRLFIAFFTIMALMAVALMPLDMALAYPPANPVRALPSTPVERGKTFNVTVTFTAPADNFNAISLTDNAPDGWNVTVNAAWCTPIADFVSATGNKAEIAWTGQPVGFNNGTSFTAVYKVNVTDYACAGNHAFNGFLEYYSNADKNVTPGPYDETITGDSEVEVPVCASPLICCSPKSLSFSATEGGSNPANQTLEISNSGIGTISWTLSDGAGWLSENSTSGSSTSADDKTLVTVSVNTTGMSAGDYPASITITAAGAINSPWTVPVSLHISLSTSKISFWPESLSFTAVEGGSNPAIKTLDIWNSGIGTLNWTLSDDAAWLSENPTGGNSTSAHDIVVLSVNTTGMSAGDYSANITITAPGASNSPQVVPVSLHISPPTLEISFSPESLSFTAGEGGSTPANQTLEIWNSGGGTRDWSLSDDAAWLSENPTGGSSTSEHDTVAVSVDIAGMSAGDYSANITITSPGASNSPQVVPVSLHISSAAPEISFSPESLSFTAGEGGSNKTLEIWNSGIDTLNWTLTDNAAWLSENATSGSSTGADDKTLVTVSVNTAGMSAGDYSANITITAPGASNTPQTVSVSLHMEGAGPSPSPIPAWLSQYWWAIVAGIVVVVLLVYLLRRRRRWA
jgi:predicted secreted protein